MEHPVLQPVEQPVLRWVYCASSAPVRALGSAFRAASIAEPLCVAPKIRTGASGVPRPAISSAIPWVDRLSRLLAWEEGDIPTTMITNIASVRAITFSADVGMSRMRIPPYAMCNDKPTFDIRSNCILHYEVVTKPLIAYPPRLRF